MARATVRPRFFMPERKEVAVAVIPARYGSTRVPAKPLADIGGRPMIARVYERTRQARSLENVVVATDDERIRRALEGIAPVVMTRADHQSGTDRVAEAAALMDCSIVVNVQGDLPLLDPVMVEALVASMRERPELEMATVAVPIGDRRELDNPSVVKVVCDGNGRALYFSRAAIPHCRDEPGSYRHALHHVGLYAYRKPTLMRFAALAPTALEQVEKLEQLRALEHGISIGVVRFQGACPMEVDTPEDLDVVRRAAATGR